MSSEDLSLKQAMALDLAAHLPTGHGNAVTREQLSRESGLSDRHVRELLETARCMGILICNDQDGKGYYVAETIEEVERQYWREKARMVSVWNAMKPLYDYLKWHDRPVRKEAGKL